MQHVCVTQFCVRARNRESRNLDVVVCMVLCSFSKLIYCLSCCSFPARSPPDPSARFSRFSASHRFFQSVTQCLALFFQRVLQVPVLPGQRLATILFHECVNICHSEILCECCQEHARPSSVGPYFSISAFITYIMRSARGSTSASRSLHRPPARTEHGSPCSGACTSMETQVQTFWIPVFRGLTSKWHFTAPVGVNADTAPARPECRRYLSIIRGSRSFSRLPLVSHGGSGLQVLACQYRPHRLCSAVFPFVRSRYGLSNSAALGSQESIGSSSLSVIIRSLLHTQFRHLSVCLFHALTPQRFEKLNTEAFLHGHLPLKVTKHQQLYAFLGHCQEQIVSAQELPVGCATNS